MTTSNTRAPSPAPVSEIRITRKHVDALEELSAANCTGFPGCKVNHFTIDEIQSVIRALASGDSLRIERSEALLAFQRLELQNYSGAREIIAGWLSRPTNNEVSET